MTWLKRKSANAAVVAALIVASLGYGCRPSAKIQPPPPPGVGDDNPAGIDAPPPIVPNDDKSPPVGKAVKFDEPAGISYADGKLYIADTNSHQIRTIDLNDGYRTSTLQIEGLQPPSVPPEPTPVAKADDEPAEVEVVESDVVSDEGEAASGDIAGDDPRTAKPRPPTLPGDDAELEPAFPFPLQISLAENGFEFPQDEKLWINTDQPLRVEDLKGKFVILDFWTYCCINCIHILPELKKLERAYPSNLVVIGVHCAKFETEKDYDNIAEAVLRYEIEHPVLNDADHEIWQMMGVEAWPSIRMIDPEGNLVYGRSSEFTFEDMDHVFQATLPYYRDKGLLDERPMKFDLLRDKQNPSPLRFPGKVLADEKSNRLFIADSNNNRLVISTLDGKLLDTIGTGAIGQDDGGYEEATFNKPQGMALLDETLYVADTENHLLRKIDLEKKTVTTIAGTGVQGRTAWPGLDNLRPFAAPPKQFVARPQEFAINSPWDLYIHEDDLYIAMAGPHQIWKMKLDESEIGPYAGNGREDIVDGLLLPDTPYQQSGIAPPQRIETDTHEVPYSAFAQPSGLTSDGQWLYVADSEGSSIRAVPFSNKRDVKTIIGTSKLPYNRLFTFGNRDGQGLLKMSAAEGPFRTRAEQFEGPMLQHCLGVVYHDGKIYAADTYNSAVKEIDVATGVCKTIAGEFPTSVPANESPK